MAYSHSHFAAYRDLHQDPSLDSKAPVYLDDDQDSAVLDPAILEADVMQSPNVAALPYRKDSFASNGVLSPPAEASAWDHHQYATCPPDAAAPSNNPYRDEHGSYVRHTSSASQAPPPFAHQQHHPPQWTFEQNSGQCTPTNNADFMPPPPSFDQPHFVLQQAGSVPHPSSFVQPPPHPSRHFNPIPPAPEPGFMSTQQQQQVQTPMSPHSHQDWMALAEQENSRARHAPKRMRANSPPKTIVELQRRDGIRKKNGRIEIPQERNIHTIDELIDKTTDEDLLKELKQQKRLLRNREAALASRQRKKKHTEDLEVKEKGYTQQIAMLEKQLSDMHFAHEELQRAKQSVWRQKEEARRVIDLVEEQKRDLIMKHTEETSVLRKRIQILTDQVEHGPVAMSAAPSSSGFTDFNAEMEALNMGHDMDNFLLVDSIYGDPTANDGFSFEAISDLGKRPATIEKKQSSTAVAPVSVQKHSDGGADQPIASGLLFMLLLCGAFVASKPSGSTASDLPSMPAEVRAAAPTVLNNLLAEAGSHTIQHARPPVQPTSQREAAPSLATSQRVRPRNKMDDMHRHLTTPTKQQEIDSAFSLTTSQYASLTEMPPHARTIPGQSRPRRNLADALAGMEHSHGGKAEVYTRSLLWDQIPADVVKQFKEMVRDHEEIESKRHQYLGRNDANEEYGNMFGYKLEG